MEKQKEYCVYGHFYNGVIFYIGSGAYSRDKILRSRPYDFGNRSEDWKKFSEGNTDQVKVRVFLRTNNRQEAFDFEEELTRRYFDHKAPLVNKSIGTRTSEETKRKQREASTGIKRSEETKKRMSESHKGRRRSEEARRKLSEAISGANHPRSKKVLVINNEINEESKVFDSITGAYEFISLNGFDKSKSTLQNYLRKGPHSFKEYTIEIA